VSDTAPIRTWCPTLRITGEIAITGEFFAITGESRDQATPAAGSLSPVRCDVSMRA